MLNRKTIGIMAAAVLGLLLPATALALTLRAAAQARAATTASAASRTVPVSSTSKGLPQVGALYPNGATAVHDCTASVVNSPQGNTLITAAHCVSGNGKGMVFVPAEHGGLAPYGHWTITAAHVPPAWVTRQDPDEDVAFLTVAPQTINGKRTEIQQVTGGYRLGLTAKRGERVTVTGYPVGTTNNPITCTVRIYMTDEFPTFDCHGYVGGTSGSPWVLRTAHGRQIVGVIGGRNQGGCAESTSYSSPLSKSVSTYRRASSGARADVVPAPRGDGC